MNIFKKIVSLVMLSAIICLLIGKTLHTFSDEHKNYLCCTLSDCDSKCSSSESCSEEQCHSDDQSNEKDPSHSGDQNNDDEQQKSEHKHTCAVLDYVISNFIAFEGTPSIVDLIYVSSHFAEYVPKEYCIILIEESTRGPPLA